MEGTAICSEYVPSLDDQEQGYLSLNVPLAFFVDFKFIHSLSCNFQFSSAFISAENLLL